MFNEIKYTKIVVNYVNGKSDEFEDSKQNDFLYEWVVASEGNNIFAYIIKNKKVVIFKDKIASVEIYANKEIPNYNANKPKLEDDSEVVPVL